ncbi:hypothetical protein ISN45_Aa01g012200 [Arabidopsis thaliana x Arabidopsis arenosa]|uniref:Uncharacterized protein n=1 Tax=Arabidopsis thaliana x Arabidopsis arenosa TaxID=1240361 RepID=A0A8T2C340_9BRAS|nr:hypothetical protein ISN45_Aa01g012200 [Arabidopsis thaliana x Arabidopsis arenosa]
MGLRAFRQWNQSEVKTAENEGIVDAGPGDDECETKEDILLTSSTTSISLSRPPLYPSQSPSPFFPLSFDFVINPNFTSLFRLVFATGYPKRFKSRREKISELLFYCRVNRCIRCDHLELTIPGDDEEGEANLGCGVAGDDGVTRVDVDEDYEEAGANLGVARILEKASIDVFEFGYS